MSRSRPGAADEPAIRLNWPRSLLLALVVAGLFAAYLSAELAQNHEPGFPLDDSWIHLTFARNLARGWGFAYNRGEPVAGSTAPLWTFILAFFHLFTRNAAAMVVIAKLLGAALLFASAVFAFRVAAWTTPETRANAGPCAACGKVIGGERTGSAAGLAVATLGPLGWAMMSGMEVTLSVALTLAGIYYYLRFRAGWKSTLAWFLFGFAAWARPESLLLAAFAILDSLVRRFALKQRFAFWRGFAVWLAIVFAWLGFNYSLSRTLFPLTYFAKAGRTSLFTAIAVGDLRQLRGLLTISAPSSFADFCLHLWRANPVLCLLAPVGLVGLIASAFGRGRANGLLIPLVVLGYAPLIGLVSPSYGVAFQNGRYIGNVTALAGVAAAVGAAYLWRWVRRPRVGAAITALLLGPAVFNAATVSVATVRNVTRAESSINRMQVALGRLLAANTPAGATIACIDIGAIGYFADRRILDLSGLVTKELRGFGYDREDFTALFRDYRPDFVAIYPAVAPDLQDAPFLQPVTYAAVPDNTASMLGFPARPKALAGVLILDLVVEPAPVTMTVFECDYQLLPPAGVR